MMGGGGAESDRSKELSLNQMLNNAHIEENITASIREKPSIQS